MRLNRFNSYFHSGLSGQDGFRWVLIFSLSTFLCAGCSLFFGNVRPVEEKAKDYSIEDLSSEKSNWKLTTKQVAGSGSEYGRSDIAYQSLKTSSVISISSACRQFPQVERAGSLRELTRELLLGLSDVTFREEKEIKIGTTSALQTIVEGKMVDRKIKMSVVVVQLEQCLFDLMYVASPEAFPKEVETFNRFVQSIRVGS